MFFTSGRDFRIVVAARTVSLLGDEVALVALLLRTQARADAWAVVALLVAGTAPLMLLAPLVGRLVDRFDSRMLLLMSSVVHIGCCVGLASCDNRAVTLTLVAVLGAGEAVSSTTWQSLVPVIVGIDQLAAATGTTQAAGTLAGVAAPVIGGVLTGLFGASVPLLVDAASFGVVAVAALTVRTRRRIGPAAPGADGRGGWAIVWSDPALRLLLAMLALFICLAGMVNVVEVFLIRQSLHADATWYGLLGGCWGSGAVVGALAGRHRQGQRAFAQVAVAGCTGLGVALAAMGLAPAVGWLIPLALLGGSSIGLVNLGINTLVGLRSPADLRGRISAGVGGVASAAQLGSLGLGGLLSAVFTPRAVFVLAGGFAIVAPLALCRGLLRATAEPALA